MRRAAGWLPWALAAALPLALGLASSVGSSGLGPLDLLRAAGEALGLLPARLSEVDRAILLGVRLSRVSLAALVGAGL
ncbi:MAG: iron ABC transporter permease, partial [Deltaproteobacteria bacterium]|nr:iron ABC transporter permease [Deltaproteobacteria bacterium]